jgi:hypothetical protein
LTTQFGKRVLTEKGEKVEYRVKPEALNNVRYGCWSEWAYNKELKVQVKNSRKAITFGKKGVKLCHKGGGRRYV